MYIIKFRSTTFNWSVIGARAAVVMALFARRRHSPVEDAGVGVSDDDHDEGYCGDDKREHSEDDGPLRCCHLVSPGEIFFLE